MALQHNAYVLNAANSDLILGTNDTERMRITSGGIVLIGMTSSYASKRLQVQGGISTDSISFTGGAEGTTIYADYGGYPPRLVINCGIPGDDGSIEFRTGESLRLTIDAFGGTSVFTTAVQATSFIQSSDIRLKNVVSTLLSNDGIDAISYTLKSDGTMNWGYSAQQVKQVLPFAVSEDADGFLKVNYTTVHTYKIAMLEKEIQDLKAELDTLKNN